jgi:hypothetical protein
VNYPQVFHSSKVFLFYALHFRKSIRAKYTREEDGRFCIWRYHLSYRRRHLTLWLKFAFPSSFTEKYLKHSRMNRKFSSKLVPWSSNRSVNHIYTARLPSSLFRVHFLFLRQKRMCRKVFQQRVLKDYNTFFLFCQCSFPRKRHYSQGFAWLGLWRARVEDCLLKAVLFRHCI